MSALLDRLLSVAAPQALGRVVSTLGMAVDVTGLKVALNDIVSINDAAYQVIAAGERQATVMPLDEARPPVPGDEVRVSRSGALVPIGPGLLGRVIDPLGRPLDGKGPLVDVQWVSDQALTPNPMTRSRIRDRITTGVRALDCFTTLGAGQRMGLFAGSGVGKSSLLSMIARGTDAQMSVIALIGERGREVREFLEDDLGEEGLARSVVVVATSDRPPLMRQKAGFAATRICEAMRDSGANVLLMMDSLTRVARAHREVALAAGEVPATRSYPPSMPAMLASLLERAGTNERGSISGIYTVLVEGDDHNDPVADEARSILDGHIVLSRDLATQGHFPSIDVLGSVSRTASKTNSTQMLRDSTAVRRAMKARASVLDLIDVNAYAPGSRPDADAALGAWPEIEAFLQQGMGESTSEEESWDRLARLAQMVRVEG